MVPFYHKVYYWNTVYHICIICSFSVLIKTCIKYGLPDIHFCIQKYRHWNKYTRHLNVWSCVTVDLACVEPHASRKCASEHWSLDASSHSWMDLEFSEPQGSTSEVLMCFFDSPVIFKNVWYMLEKFFFHFSKAYTALYMPLRSRRVFTDYRVNISYHNGCVIETFGEYFLEEFYLQDVFYKKVLFSWCYKFKPPKNQRQQSCVQPQKYRKE